MAAAFFGEDELTAPFVALKQTSVINYNCFMLSRDWKRKKNLTDSFSVTVKKKNVYFENFVL